jgi:hypothetical protein
VARKHITRHINADHWVSFETSEGKSHRGRITAKDKRVVRVVDSQGRQYSTSPTERGAKIRFKSIRALKMGVFLLDTQLDKQWKSTRRGAVFWEEYCRHAGWSFAFERVHSLADLSYILSRSIQEHVLIFNGHSNRSNSWKLSNGDKLDKTTQLKINDKNRHKVLLFSSCNIGGNEALCLRFKKLFQAHAVIGYSAPISDDFCFLVEPALLQLIQHGKQPWEATQIVRDAFDPWKGLNHPHAKVFPIQCHR